MENNYQQTGLKVRHFFQAHLCDKFSIFRRTAQILGAQLKILGAQLKILGALQTFIHSV